MSRTLFWYIFKDLVRIFFMASGALAGIMSFGGLLRPLTRQGLDAVQVGQVLTYFMPAMTTYSLPVAALFATTVVYGRLAADNELTACRAGGVSLLSLSVAGPALVLGLLVALMSLLFLCFVVPAYTLKVEKVLYSNLAKFVQSQIERTHSIPFAGSNVFAQDAVIPPPDAQHPGRQQVILVGPTIVTSEQPHQNDAAYRVPKEFWTASRATLYIEQNPGDEQVDLTVRLDNGFKFPRRFFGAVQAGVEETEYGPIRFNSPIKENTKFMNVWRLKSLYAHPGESLKLASIVSGFVRRDQRTAYVTDLAEKLNAPEHEVVFRFPSAEPYVLSRDGNVPALVNGDQLVAAAPQGETALPLSLRHRDGDRVVVIQARRLQVKAQPLPDSAEIDAAVELDDCSVQTDTGPVRRANFTQHFTVPMSPAVADLAHRDLSHYMGPDAAGAGDQRYLQHEFTELVNEIVAESNSRASFSISCLILVMVGCALGMMFKSGNFLTAFAVSFVPALLSITLVIAGQRTAGNVPSRLDAANPLQLGLALIWAGNVLNLVLASVLLLRLHRK